MAERGFGRIVFLSSVSAERGGGVFGGVAYSAAKAALLGFAKSLAHEPGPSGVTVNSVAPGLIDTDITQGKPAEVARDARCVPAALLGFFPSLPTETLTVPHPREPAEHAV